MMVEELDRLAAHPLMARFITSLAQHPAQEITVGATVRRAAILLVVRAQDDGEPEILLIKRAEAEGDPWSGHIACPGGRMEPGDQDLAATAVRETWEETGIDISRDGRLLGQLDDLSPRSRMLKPIMIRPFVALVRSDIEIVPSHEVASAFWVPLAALRDRAAWSTGAVQATDGERRERIFQHGDHMVWGLTERALRQLLTYVGEPPDE